MKKILLLALGFSGYLFCLPVQAENFSRFFIVGDGEIKLQNQTIRYRDSQGNYLEPGLQKIHQIFGAPWNVPEERLSLRFIEVIDYVQDSLQGGSYALKSGYRSPKLNQKLRDQGKLAAQSSMHTEGAAADLQLGGVASSQVFDFVKSLNCCGIGWYHSAHFHIDAGPPRYWDETSSKTEDKTPQENEKIILQPIYDRYQAGETLVLQWMRVTSYPVGVPSQVELVSVDPGSSKSVSLTAEYKTPLEGDSCKVLANRSQARQLQLQLPPKIPAGKYAVKVKFCNRYDHAKMPEEILSREFEVVTAKN